jgi:hypothetical protein
MMKNPNTGVIKKGFYGFSWTTFLFGGIPALFRGDIITGLVVGPFLVGFIWEAMK